MKNIIDEIYDNDLFHLTDVSKVGKEYTDAMGRLCTAERKMPDKCPDIKDAFYEYQSAQLVLEMIKPIK